MAQWVVSKSETPIPWFIIILPIKSIQKCYFGGVPFFLTPNYCTICCWLLYIYIIYMCTVYPCLVSHLQIFGLTTPSPFLSGRNICMICVFSRYYPEFKMFGTHPIIMLLVCVCVSHYYHHNGWYSVWTIPHYYLLYCWLNWYCIMFILIIITKHTHYIHIYIYTYIYTYIWKYVCIQWYVNLNIIPLWLV